MYTIDELRAMAGYAPLPSYTFLGNPNTGMYSVGMTYMTMNVSVWSPVRALLDEWQGIDHIVQSVDGMYDRRYCELIVYEVLEKARLHFEQDFDVERELKVSIVNFENRAARSVKVEALSEIGNTFIDQLNDLETQVELMDWHK